MLKQLYLPLLILLLSNFSIMAQAPCDPKPPVAVCDEVVVLSLDDESSATLFAASIDDGSSAYTCGSDEIGLTIARVDACDGDCNEDNFSTAVDFTEDDVFESFFVILKVTDELGKSNQCMTTVKVLDKSDHGDENNPLGSDNGGCTLACLDNITAALGNEGTTKIWAVDFLESLCSGRLLLKIQDADQNVIFEKTSESHWTATGDDVDKPYVYTVTHEATGNSCWGNVLIIDKLDNDGTTNNPDKDPDAEDPQTEGFTCPEIAIDFSSYTVDEELEFEDVSLAAVNAQLASTYAKAFNDMISANGIDPASNEYVVAYNISDEIFKFDNGDLKVVRTITLLDWCNFDPTNGNNGIKEVTQVIRIANLAAMVVADINYAEGSTSIPVNEIFLKNENGQVAMPALSTDETLTTSITNTLQTAKWEKGNYDIEVEKYDACSNGVSSNDMVQVMRHILGLNVLDSNTKIVAADFDENGKVSAADLVSMRKTILGIDDCNNDSNWRFYKRSINKANDFTLDRLADFNLSYAVDQDESLDIIALKKGDVNLSVIDNKKTKSKKTQITVEDIEMIAGHEYDLNFMAAEDFEIASGDFDFELSPDFKIAGFSSTTLEIEDHHYHVGDNKAKLVWYDEENAFFNKGEIVFTLHIRSNVDAQISDILIPSMTDLEIYASAESNKSIKTEISYYKKEGYTKNLVSTYSVYIDNDQLTINADENNQDLIKTVEVFNRSGQRLYTNQNVDQKEWVTNINDHNTDILIYRVVSDSGQVQSGKVMAY